MITFIADDVVMLTLIDGGPESRSVNVYGPSVVVDGLDKVKVRIVIGEHEFYFERFFDLVANVWHVVVEGCGGKVRLLMKATSTS